MRGFRRSPSIALIVFSLAASTLLWASTLWIQRVPAREHARANPLAGNSQSMAAGQLLYADHCAMCHGDEARGKGKKPSLRSDRVQEDATPGDLHWLLVNGDLVRGMPSWSKLPDQQLWQIVSYLKSLN